MHFDLLTSLLMRMIVKKKIMLKTIFELFFECRLFPIGNLKEDGDIVEKDHTFSTAKDSFPVEREQAEEEEIYELSSGDEDYSKGMRSMIFFSLF